MPDVVSLVIRIKKKETGIYTISDDHDVSMNGCSILELHARESLLDADNFLAQAKLATRLKGSFVQHLLVVRSPYR